MNTKIKKVTSVTEGESGTQQEAKLLTRYLLGMVFFRENKYH